MARSSFLADMLATLFERSWSAAGTTDARTIKELCLALLSEKAEMSGIQLASTVLNRYRTLEPDEKKAFFTFLNDDLDIDAASIATLAGRYEDDKSAENFAALTSAAEPGRQELLRRLNEAPGATAELVAMRVDLLEYISDAPELARTDRDITHLLGSWFNRGFLVLRRIDWHSPATILEKIIAYEAVHAINDWDDLRRRLHPADRSCFAFFHPAMPDDPLIFVEVALTRSIPNSIQTVLAPEREVEDKQAATTAVFYSISNCQSGLRGISFGNSLIKQVVAELSQDLPQLKTFVTLSPLPGLNTWLGELENDPRAARVLDRTATDDETRQMAARYLLTAKSYDNTPRDPVARFHLGNGATIHDVHARADTSQNGLAQSSGIMVNYLYDLDATEKNHEAFVSRYHIAASKAVQTLAKSAAGKN